MSLYDDIISKKETSHEVTEDWSSKSSSIKLLQDHLQIKRTTQNLAKKNLNNRKLPSTNPNSYLQTNYSIPSNGVDSFNISKSSSLLGGDWDITDEYDPRWPNDYEKIVREAKEKEMSSKFNSKFENSSQVIATRSLGLDYDDEDEDEYDDEKSEEKTKSRANASIAPPPSLLENVEKKAPGSAGFGVSSVAAKIMAKMGYKEGQGLGREEQGISKALQVEKTGVSQGIIVYETEAKKNEELPITDMLKAPSKVVLLRNMVGPGEVDEELEPETREECSKYGEVASSAIFEVANYEREEEAVCIFIEFYRVESAIKALIDLNGRYFGGRIVKASFYDIDRYKRRDFNVQ